MARILMATLVHKDLELAASYASESDYTPISDLMESTADLFVIGHEYTHILQGRICRFGHRRFL